MGIHIPNIVHQAKQIIRGRSPSATLRVPKGHFVIYVGEEEKKKRKRFVVPLSYLNHPLFQELLRKAEEEFGFDHQMGGLTIPCSEAYFINLISRMNNGP